MNKKFRYILCFICIAAIVINLGCSINTSNTGSTITPSNKNANKLTLDEIKLSYSKTNEKIINVQEYKNYALVESQVPTFANRFTLYNLETGDEDALQNGDDYIDSAKIIDENHIILYAKGTHSESALQVFPYEIDCVRGTENKSYNGDFIPTNKDIKFPIDKQISLNGKDMEEINNIWVTANGLQICFGPQSIDDIGFYADYTDCPATDISYDQTAEEFLLKFQDTVIAKSLSSTNISLQDNSYIKSLNLKEIGKSAIFTIKLKDTAKYFVGKKSNVFEYEANIDIPYMDIQFSGSNDDLK